MLQEKISYDEIRNKKIEEYGTAFEDWIWILVKQYKDRTHFLFELLQNAEDAKATEVKLTLKKDKLIIEHNGILFSKADVISITKVAKSTKSGGEGGSIGKFGIGFKSVYAYASTPRIYSGAYSFEIRKFIYPYELPGMQLPPDITKIEIPFNNGEIEASKAFSEIRRALYEQINGATLLFLNNIDNLEIRIEGAGSPIRISKEDRERKGTGGSVLDVNILYESVHKQTEDNYLLFTDCEEEAVKIAFKVEGKELVPVPNTNIFTFFPTDKESHQSFYMHAPFETTPARDIIVEDSERNLQFVENICRGLQCAFCWLRDNGYLSIEGLNATYPIYRYPEETIFYRIYEQAIQIIASGEKLIPTNKPGVYKDKGEILLPDNMSIVDVFHDEDIQRLFVNHKLFWIAKEISRDSFQRFREFLKSNFDFKTYTWRDVISRLDASYLKTKEVTWYEKLFSAIHSFAVTVTGGQGIGRYDIDVSRIPFVRLANGEQVCAYKNGKPVVYMNNPESCPNKIDAAFCKSGIISNFYTFNLRIPIYNVERIAVDDILPKYTVKNKVTASMAENIADLKTIKDALQVAPGLLESVANVYMITDGQGEWYRPAEIHIPSGYGSNIPEYALVKDVCKLHFLSMTYQSEPKLDEKFFLSIGCAGSLRRTQIQRDDYLSLVSKYIGRQEREEIRKRIFSKEYQHGLKWDVMFEGFPQVFEKVDLKKSIKIASFLNRNTTQFEIQGEIAGANDQNFSGANVDSMRIYSGLGLLLTFIPWVYTKEGVKKAVCEIHRQELDPRYEKEARRLMDFLPFLEEDAVIEELLARFDDPGQREMIKELLTNEESLTQVVKAWNNQKLKALKDKDKKNKTPEQILAEMAKKKGRGSAKGKGEDPEPIENLERRKARLEKEFVETLDFKNTVSKTSLKFTYQDHVPAEEKTFLNAQYDGFCQICNTTILKTNGEHYFEAINVMRTSELDDKYKASLDLGWNSLCLCPNCAAKYRYGVKDVSDFYQQVHDHEVEEGNDCYIEIHISLQDSKEIIHYAPKHFLALKTAMEVFAKN